MNLHHFACHYHRNGVFGEGFHLCSFEFGRGKNKRAVTAVVFEGKGRCAVISDDIKEMFRGDVFEDDLRALIAANDKTNS